MSNQINIEKEPNQDQRQISLSERQIALGDQSPTAGGLLRLFTSQILGIPTVYFHHSTDAPWLQTGSPKIVSRGGFQQYWSTASRNPFSLWGSKNGKDHDELLAFGNSVKSPPGLVTLQGPNTVYTFYSSELCPNPQVQTLTQKMLIQEVQWARAIANRMGYSDGLRIADEALDILTKSDKSHIGDMGFQLYQELTNPGQEFSSSIQVFTQPKSLNPFLESNLAGEIGEYYWEIDLKTGTRKPASNGRLMPGTILVPKAAMLPIELAMQDYAVGITGMGYADEVRELRNQIAPDLQIPIVQYKFNMQVPEIFQAMWSEFVVKRAEKGNPVSLQYGLDVLSVLKQWQARPTYLFALITGISITVEILHHQDISDYINSLEI